MEDYINPRDVKVENPGQIPVYQFDAEEMERREHWAANREQRKQTGFKRAQIGTYIASLYASNQTLAAIIEQTQEEFELEEPLTLSQVRHYIDNQIEYWKQEGIKNIDHKRALHLQNVRNIEELATNAYFASMSGKMVHNYEKQIERARERKAQVKMRERALEEKKPVPLDTELWAEAEATDTERETIGELGEGDLEKHLVTVSERIKEYKRYESNAAGDAKFLELMLKCAQERAKIWNLYVQTEDDNGDSEFARMSDVDKTKRIAQIITNVQNRIGTGPMNSSELAPQGPLYGGREAYEQQKKEDEAEAKRLKD